MRVLVFKLGAFGDVMMTTPLVKAISQEHEVDYLIGESSLPAIKNNPDISNIITFNQDIFYKKQILGMLALIAKIKKRKYDIIFVLDKHWIFGLFAKMCKIKTRVGFKRDDKNYLTHSSEYKKVKHEVDYYNDLYKPFTQKAINKSLVYNIVDKYKNPLPKKFVCIAVGGGTNPGEKNPIRRVPSDIYNDIISKINIPVLLVGRKDDIGSSNEIINNGNVYNLVGATNWDETADIMSKSSLVICADSGPMHLASSCADNIISIFGCTNPMRKAPLVCSNRQRRHVFWNDQDIYEEEYELFGKLPAEDKIWFTEIDVDEILNEYGVI